MKLLNKECIEPLKSVLIPPFNWYEFNAFFFGKRGELSWESILISRFLRAQHPSKIRFHKVGVPLLCFFYISETIHHFKKMLLNDKS